MVLLIAILWNEEACQEENDCDFVTGRNQFLVSFTIDFPSKFWFDE